jgi:glycosyltransferase involved in cell wall biosynthesis
MARHFQTTVIVPQSQVEINFALQLRPDLAAVRWLSKWDFSPGRGLSLFHKVRHRLNTRREENLRRRWSGIYRDWYFGPLGSWVTVLDYALRQFTPDVVMIEHTRHAATLDMVRRFQPTPLAVVDSHNVESELLRQVLPKSMPAHEHQRIVRGLEDYERQLDHRCDVLWSCSAQDAARYKGLGIHRPKLCVVPNGVDIRAIPFRAFSNERIHPRVLFTGTLCYEPNEDGILWFHREVWPRLRDLVPNIRWQIVGRGPTQEILNLVAQDKTIDLAADVTSVQPYLEQAQVGICPLWSGSGTRLKILEAFSAGLPIVSTTLGAEGIDAVPDRDLLLADDPESFAVAIGFLLQNPREAERIRHNARRLAEEKYDWSVIGNNAAGHLLSALSIKAQAAKTKRLV